MMEKAYFLFLCILLISGLFLPSTAAGRALLQTAETEGEGGGNDGSKMGVIGSQAKTAPSRTEVSSPSKPTPVGKINYAKSAAVVSCGRGRGYRTCIPRSNRAAPSKCSDYVRNCK